MTNARVTLYASKYDTDNKAPIVGQIMNKQLGFELEITSDQERYRRILTKEELENLQTSIRGALVAYEDTIKFRCHY